MKKILIATNNKGKVKEFQELLKGLPFELVTPAEIHLSLEVEENGANYIENAAKKARAFAQASGLIALADDSGLEVDALNGAPGLYSARYHPKPGASDAERRAYLIENLQGKPRPWTAHFHATIAIAFPANAESEVSDFGAKTEGFALPKIYFAEGDCYGEIIPEERGANGFGYDPIFLFPELNQTMAELDMEAKNRLSHRAKAAMNAIPMLKSKLSA
ncbi:MAG: XTP/dITP diphosphatase [Anaerolineales bacterium]